jgi:formate dehydrogenase subunit gamma
MEQIDDIVSCYAGRPQMLQVALQQIQGAVGYIPTDAVHQLSASLGVPEGEVQAVISFYTELRTAPRGKHHLRVCHGDSCAALGSRNVLRAVEEHLGVPESHGSTGTPFTYDMVYCLGNCALSPSISIDDEVYGRVTPQEVVRHIQEATND